MLRNWKVRRLIKSGSVLGLMLLVGWLNPSWLNGAACGIWLCNVIVDVIDYLDR